MDILEQERSVTVPAMETCWHGIVTTKAPFLKVVYRLVFCQQNVLDGANPCMNSDKQKKQSLSHGRGGGGRTSLGARLHDVTVANTDDKHKITVA